VEVESVFCAVGLIMAMKKWTDHVMGGARGAGASGRISYVGDRM